MKSGKEYYIERDIFTKFIFVLSKNILIQSFSKSSSSSYYCFSSTKPIQIIMGYDRVPTITADIYISERAIPWSSIVYF